MSKRIAKPSKANKEGVWWLYCEHKINSQIAPDYGKWLLFLNEQYVDEDWAKLVRAFDNGELSAQGMKVSTRWGREQKGYDKYVICVYTSLDKEDIMRVREELRKLGFTNRIPYKTDEATLQGRYGKGAAAFWA